MPFNNLTNNHQSGRIFFGYPHLKSLSIKEYFNCLNLLRLLFKNPDFQNSTPGFYINYAPGGKERISLRFTYFTTNSIETEKVIKNFGESNKDKIKIYDLKKPKSCDPEKLRFRRYLNAYTQIGLDLLENFGRDCSRKLVADYRFNCNPHHPNLWQVYPKEFFEPIFSKYSQFFKNLNDDYSDEQLWEDLKRADSEGVWLHFLVNMLLPADCCPNREGKIEYGRGIPETTKRTFLNMINLNLPDNWRDSCNF